MVTILKGYKKYTSQELLEMDKYKAIIYARVSTQMQARKGSSITSQIEEGAKLARNKFGYTDNEILAIAEEGESGDDPDRPGMNHVLFLLEQGVGKKLIIFHPDRMSRYLALQNEIASRVWGCGVDIEFVELEVDPDNPESMLMFNLQGSIAEYNKKKILSNSKRGRRQKVKNGKIPGLRRAYGYTFDKELDTLVENTKEKEVYLLMIDWLLNGKEGEEMNCTKIAKELARLNYPAPCGNKWYQTTIGKILRNEIYMGNFYYGKTEIKQYKGKKNIINKDREEWYAIPIPPYIDKNIFDKVQRKLDSLIKNSGGRNTINYLLKGLVRCGRCGASVASGSVSKLKDKTLRYYACTRKTKKNFEVGTGYANEVCKGSNWRQDVVDEKVWDFLCECLKSPDEIINQITKQQSNAEYSESIKTKIIKIENKIIKKQEEQKRCFTAYKEGLIPMELFKEEIDEVKEVINTLNEELIILKNQYEQLNVSNDKLESLKKNIETYRQIMFQDKLITFEQKRKIILQYIERVILHEDNKIEIVFKWGKEDNNNPHRNILHRQDEALYFYVDFIEDIPATPRSYVSKVDAMPKEVVDKLIHMYQDEKLTLMQIEKEMGIKWWTVKSLFEKHNIERMNLRDRARLKREKDFDLIYKLHFTEEKTIKEIYEKYKFSPPYIKQVLADKELKPINRGQFIKK